MSCSASVQVATAETAEARAGPRRRLQRRTLAAVRAAGGAEGAGPLWLLALEALAAAGAPLGTLLDQLVAVCLGRGAGPLQVRRPLRGLIARHMAVDPVQTHVKNYFLFAKPSEGCGRSAGSAAYGGS